LLAAAPAAAELSCPPRIELTPEVRITPPPGWRALPEPQSHWLRGAALYLGDPAGRAQLVPEEDRQRRVSYWDLTAEPHTLVCEYEGTEMRIAAPVPAGLKRCTIETFRQTSQGVRFGRPVIGPNDWVRVACR
jgi:hypothetical protein